MKQRIALTGGIASGKSTAIAYIKSLGYPVFSCDEIYKQVINQEEYIQEISRFFPASVQEGKIDRKILSELVFNDKQKRKKLDEIAHPLIMKELYKQMDERDESYVFAEVPLLFESGYEGDFDKVIVIKRNLEDRIADLIKRDNISREDARKKLDAQFDYDAPNADIRFKNCEAIIIQNEGSLLELQNQIDRAVLQILPKL